MFSNYDPQTVFPAMSPGSLTIPAEAAWPAGGSYLHVARQREVFPERVALEAVIRQDPSQVRMVGEEDTKHVPDLEDTFGEPVRHGRVQLGGTGPL